MHPGTIQNISGNRFWICGKLQMVPERIYAPETLQIPSKVYKFEDYKPNSTPPYIGILRSNLNKIIYTFSSSSTNILNLYNDDRDSYFSSKNGPGEFIKIFFDTNLIHLSHYSIQGWENAPNGEYPYSWEILGSNDDKNWFVLDKQLKNDILKDKKPHLFKLQRIGKRVKMIKNEEAVHQ